MPASSSHILDDLLDVADDRTGIRNTGLDLAQVVVFDEAPQETANELLFRLEVDVSYFV